MEVARESHRAAGTDARAQLCFSRSRGALWQPKTVTVAMRSHARCWALENTFVLYHFIVCNWFPTEFVCLVCFAVCFWEYSASLYFNYSKI